MDESIAPTAPGALRRLWPRIRRWALRALVFCLLAPFVLILPLNLIQPPTTAMILRRAVQRAAADRTPAYPRRDIVPRAAISPLLRRAVLAAEDDRFYLHWGFDLVELGKAVETARRGGRLRGASTVTQQVAKNIFLWEGQSFVRKGIEAYLTLVLEICLSKERILDIYLNLAEWGDGVFGAEMAAQRHYGVSARALTAEQAARLAAVLPSPRRWNPEGPLATSRLPIILEVMSRPALRE